jgi:hypothetical protein
MLVPCFRSLDYTVLVDWYYVTPKLETYPLLAGEPNNSRCSALELIRLVDYWDPSLLVQWRPTTFYSSEIICIRNDAFSRGEFMFGKRCGMTDDGQVGLTIESTFHIRVIISNEG